MWCAIVQPPRSQASSQTNLFVTISEMQSLSLSERSIASLMNCNPMHTCLPDLSIFLSLQQTYTFPWQTQESSCLSYGIKGWEWSTTFLRSHTLRSTHPLWGTGHNTLLLSSIYETFMAAPKPPQIRVKLSEDGHHETRLCINIKNCFIQGPTEIKGVLCDLRRQTLQRTYLEDHVHCHWEWTDWEVPLNSHQTVT